MMLIHCEVENIKNFPLASTSNLRYSIKNLAIEYEIIYIRILLAVQPFLYIYNIRLPAIIKLIDVSNSRTGNNGTSTGAEAAI